jgi:surfeit locus 1 family protein
VDRGYVLQTISSRPAVIPGDSYPFKVTGFLISPIRELTRPTGKVEFDKPLPPVAPGSKLWMNRDLPGMAAALGIRDPAPYFLAAENSTNPDWQALRPGLPPVIISNNHLQYAFTWFALAGVLAAIYAAMLKKRLKA